MKDLPILNMEALSLKRCLAHGKAVALSITVDIETYLAHFEASGLTRNVDRAEGNTWISVNNGRNPAYGEEMRGIAEGAGFAPFDTGFDRPHRRNNTP
ncbi:MAG: hypothetical protein VYE18_03805 [Pseudomonadota bacterium]|nr:hypothetical protein [Pseudomonadota bacterium]